MARFYKVSSDKQMLAGRVLLILHKEADGQPYGSIFLPPTITPNGDSKFSMPGNEPAKDAVLVAGKFADERKTDVDVRDHDNLWQSEWGKLE
jgi:hypothetical protein